MWQSLKGRAELWLWGGYPPAPLEEDRRQIPKSCKSQTNALVWRGKDASVSCCYVSTKSSCLSFITYSSLSLAIWYLPSEDFWKSSFLCPSPTCHKVETKGQLKLRKSWALCDHKHPFSLVVRDSLIIWVGEYCAGCFLVLWGVFCKKQTN